MRPDSRLTYLCVNPSFKPINMTSNDAEILQIREYKVVGYGCWDFYTLSCIGSFTIKSKIILLGSLFSVPQQTSRIHVSRHCCLAFW